MAFIPWSAFPDGAIPEEAYWSIAPELAVELLSPTNTRAEIDRTLRELFAVGCKLAWIINPKTRSAKSYTSAKRSREIDETALLDGGKVLPGFTIPLVNVFESTRSRKKKAP